VQRTRESFATANAIRAFRRTRLGAVLSSSWRRRAMIRELELIAISIVFVFLGAIIIGVIH
jgi:hypothetical protein